MMFADLIGKTMKVHVDDMPIKSLRVTDHVNHHENAFQILRKYRMKINPSNVLLAWPPVNS